MTKLKKDINREVEINGETYRIKVELKGIIIRKKYAHKDIIFHSWDEIIGLKPKVVLYPIPDTADPLGNWTQYV